MYSSPTQYGRAHAKARPAVSTTKVALMVFGLLLMGIVMLGGFLKLSIATFDFVISLLASAWHAVASLL